MTVRLPKTNYALCTESVLLLVLLLCLCKSFKERYLYALCPTFEAKASAKVTPFRVPTKYFGNYFLEICKNFGFIDKTLD